MQNNNNMTSHVEASVKILHSVVSTYIVYNSFYVIFLCLRLSFLCVLQEFCEGTGERGSAPPALLLILSRLCSDFESATISYLVIYTSCLSAVKHSTRRYYFQQKMLIFLHDNICSAIPH